MYDTSCYDISDIELALKPCPAMPSCAPAVPRSGATSVSPTSGAENEKDKRHGKTVLLASHPHHHAVAACNAYWNYILYIYIIIFEIPVSSAWHSSCPAWQHGSMMHYGNVSGPCWPNGKSSYEI